MVNAPEANAETKKATMEMKTPTAKTKKKEENFMSAFYFRSV